MKRVLTVQDLSCLGKCSLTVALPVLSAMGLETAVLPTAVLSTHTAFPSPAVTDLTAMMGAITDHWAQLGAAFDGICTGYLSSPEQATQVLQLTQRLRTGFWVADPVMGDGGRLYSRITPEFLGTMRTLCAQADMILPNLTEACFLTDTPYREDYDEAFISRLLEKLTDLGCDIAVITGICPTADTIGVTGYQRSTGARYHYSTPRLPHSCHGTGDVFSAVCTGAIVLGKSWQEALGIATDFTARCLRETPAEGRDRRYGLCFEKALPYLCQGLSHQG